MKSRANDTCYYAWLLGVGYPQGEKVSPQAIMDSISSATKSFPWSQALEPSVSIFLRCPKPSSDLRRLNTSSICHLARYVSSTTVAEQVRGSVVNTNIYSADSSVLGVIVCPFFLLSRAAFSFCNTCGFFALFYGAQSAFDFLTVIADNRDVPVTNL